MKDVLTSVPRFQLWYKFDVLAKENDMLGLDGNKLVQVWNIAHHFYLSSFRRAVKSTLEITV